jgi:hypothetical protein
VELQSRVQELRRQGLGVAVITYDPPEVLADFARRRGITFPLLSDRGSAIIKAYGLLNTTVAPETPAYGVPFPGTFMLDRQGRVTARFFEQAYQERATVSTMLMKGGFGLERVATTAQTAHLSLRSWAGDDALVPGRHVSLVVDVTPGPGMHVYAPGATGYRVVSLAVDEVPGLRVLETTYPASEIYFFRPLNERVPVYQQPFRLTRDVFLEASPPAAAAAGSRSSLTVSGRLDYQACDDKVCYNPMSVPLSWTFSVGSLDRERAGGR